MIRPKIHWALLWTTSIMLLAMGGSPGWAVVTVWTNEGAGSDFNTANNWEDEQFMLNFVPGPADLASHDNLDNTGMPGTIMITSDAGDSQFDFLMGVNRRGVDSFRLSHGGSVMHTGGNLNIVFEFTDDTFIPALDRGLWVGEFGNQNFARNDPMASPQSVYTLDGGTITVEDEADGFRIGTEWDPVLQGAYSDGFFDFRSGTLDVTESFSLIGVDGHARFDQMAGTFNTQSLGVGQFAAPTAVANLSGTATWNLTGPLTLSNDQTDPRFRLRPDGAGTSNLNISGSNVSINSAGLAIRGQGTLNFVADANGVSPIVSNGVFELTDRYVPGNRPQLEVDLGPATNVGSMDTVKLIDSDSLVTGEFTGLPEGTVVPNSGGRLITYRGGNDGFDVELVHPDNYVMPPDISLPEAVIGRYSMVSVQGTPGIDPAEGNPVVFDSRTGTNEGLFAATNPDFPATDTEDHLWFFSLDNGHIFTESSDVPPTSMFINGHDAGATSYDASVVTDDFVEGALFFPQDVYGNEYSFESDFSLEAFFKVTGDTEKDQAIIVQGETFNRYGVRVNDLGEVEFFVNDGEDVDDPSNIETATLPGSFADNEWHYLLATYEEGAGANGTGQLTLSIADEDGTTTTTSYDLSANFMGLPPAFNDGNFLVGALDFDGMSVGPGGLPVPVDPERFEGLIDEVQITRGLIDISDRLGFLDLMSSLACDFDGNTMCDINDIDLLVQEVVSGGGDLAFDLNGDNQVDDADIAEWLVQAGLENIGAAYLPADANLDGVVDGQDFIVWNGFKFTNSGKWSEGDFNADGVTDGQDFITWNGFKFMSSSDLVVSVPEPSLPMWLGMLALLGCWYRKRR